MDGRFLPGYEEEFFADLDQLLGPNVSSEYVHDDKARGDRLRRGARGGDAGRAAWPRTRRAGVPYMLSGGTDAKSFDDLGIRGFGFAPLKLPPELDFAGMFHGVDERVPVDGLQFGVRVLDRFLDAS